MKFYFRHPKGWKISFEREPKEPMDRDKFFVLVALAAGALFVAWMLGGVALK